MRLLLSIPVVAACLWALPAGAAGPLRCEGKLIEPGDAAAYVVARCGQPESRSVETGPMRQQTAHGVSQVVGTYEIERWIYDRGYGRFPAVLEFEHGTLQAIGYLPDRS